MSDPFEFDFDEAEQIEYKDFEPIPAGVYDVVIVDTEVRMSRGGDPMLNLQLQVEGGEYDNRVIFDLWYMPNKAKQEPDKYKTTLGFLKDKLEAITGETVAGNFRIDPREFPGRRCKAKVLVKKDAKPASEGGGFYAPKNTVRRYLPSGADVPAGETGAAPIAPAASAFRL